MDKGIAKQDFVFNHKDNGGEQLVFTTELFDNGSNYYTKQQISLHSYCNSASINLSGIEITPENLRSLANTLDAFLNKYRTKK